MRVNESFKETIDKLIAQQEVRDHKSDEREIAWQQIFSAIGTWQTKHPTDPGAHSDIRDELSGIATDQLQARERIASNSDRILVVEQGIANRRKEREAEQKVIQARIDERQKVWGFGHGTLIITSLAIGSITGLLTLLEALK